MAHELVLVLPGDPATRTGGYAYDRRMLAELERRGWRTQVLALDAGFPAPDAAALAAAQARFAALPAGTLTVVDGLALGALPQLAVAESHRLALVALVHHPLALETGLDAARRANLAASERRALAAVRGVIVTGGATVAAVAGMGVPRERIVVVEPGTDPAPPRGADVARSGAIRLLCVATLVPRKGHAVLFQALASLRALPWQLDCIGSTTRAPAEAARLDALRRELGLESRIVLHGEHDETALEAAWAAADLFVLPTLYEGHGMAVAEAIAHGLPVVASDTGSIAALVGTDAGRIVPPGDVAALATALRPLLQEPAALRACASAAARRAAALRRWPQAAVEFERALLRWHR